MIAPFLIFLRFNPRKRGWLRRKITSKRNGTSRPKEYQNQFSLRQTISVCFLLVQYSLNRTSRTDWTFVLYPIPQPFPLTFASPFPKNSRQNEQWYSTSQSNPILADHNRKQTVYRVPEWLRRFIRAVVDERNASLLKNEMAWNVHELSLDQLFPSSFSHAPSLPKSNPQKWMKFTVRTKTKKKKQKARKVKKLARIKQPTTTCFKWLSCHRLPRALVLTASLKVATEISSHEHWSCRSQSGLELKHCWRPFASARL